MRFSCDSRGGMECFLSTERDGSLLVFMFFLGRFVSVYIIYFYVALFRFPAVYPLCEVAKQGVPGRLGTLY